MIEQHCAPEQALNGTVAQPMDPTPQWNEVQIVKVENGFIARIRCKTFVAKDWDELNAGLVEYWKDPYAARKKFARD